MKFTAILLPVGLLLDSALLTVAHATATNSGELAVQAVDHLVQQAGGPHKGYRANHAKGIFVSGTFTPTTEAKNLSIAPHFGQAVPVVVRFSNATGVPNLPDASPHARPHGMAIRFRLPDGNATDIVAISTNGFPASTPEEFVGLLSAVKASATEENKPNSIDKFLKSHPAAIAFFQLPKPAPVSLAHQPFFGVNSFIFEDAAGKQQYFRYRIVPKVGARYLSEADAAKEAPDYLMNEIKVRVSQQPVEYLLQAQLPVAGDPLLDGSQVWSDDRPVVELGTIQLDSLPANTDVLDKQMFNPLLLPKGIIASKDPVLQFRPVVYAVSFGRRL